MLSRLPETGAFPTAARTAMKSAVVFCQCAFALAWAACPAMAQSASQVLGRLDATAPAFRAATAGVIWIDHQAAIDMEDKQLGTMIVKRYSPTRLQYILHITDPDVYGVALRDNTIERYMPKINLIQVYDIRRYRDLAQKLMILGFGMTGRELADGFTISGISSETVETHRATRLDLSSRSYTFPGATISW